MRGCQKSTPATPNSAGPEKKKKDPNAPKGALSAYMCFCRSTRPELKRDHPDMSSKELISLMGTKWKSLGGCSRLLLSVCFLLQTDHHLHTPADTEKEPWNQEAAQDRGRYEREMQQYKGTAAASKVLTNMLPNSLSSVHLTFWSPGKWGYCPEKRKTRKAQTPRAEKGKQTSEGQ